MDLVRVLRGRRRRLRIVVCAGALALMSFYLAHVVFMLDMAKMDGAGFVPVMQQTMAAHITSLPQYLLDQWNETDLLAALEKDVNAIDQVLAAFFDLLTSSLSTSRCTLVAAPPPGPTEAPPVCNPAAFTKACNSSPRAAMRVRGKHVAKSKKDKRARACSCIICASEGVSSATSPPPVTRNNAAINLRSGADCRIALSICWVLAKPPASGSKA